MVVDAPSLRALGIAAALLGAAGCSLLLFDSSEYGPGVRAVNDAGPDATPADADTDTDGGLGTESFIVVAGGATDAKNSAMSTAVFTSKVGDDGELSPWTEWTGTGALPEGRHRSALVAAGDSLSFVGGYTATDGSRATVFQSTFAPAGLAGWVTAPRAMPLPRGRHAAVVIGGRLYVTGGREAGNTTTTSVLAASLDESGALGAFTEARPLPTPRELHVALTHGRFVWVLTGYDSATQLGAGDGWVTEVATDGALGPFRAVTPLPGGLLVNTAGGVATDTHVYLVGGFGGSFGRVMASRYQAVDGALEGWFEPTQLRTPRASHAVVAVNGRVYAIGGLDGRGAVLSSVEVATLLPDGGLSAWKETTPLPRGLTTHSAAVVRP